MIKLFANHGGTWDLQAQLCTSLESIPIEDASVVWPENESPYVTVARLTVSPREAWNPVRAAAIDDSVAFSSWHSLAAHRPLGSVMRARKAAYEMSALFRSERNKKSDAEPMELASVPE